MIKAERERSIEREPILGDQYQEMTFKANGFLWSQEKVERHWVDSGDWMDFR